MCQLRRRITWLPGFIFSSNAPESKTGRSLQSVWKGICWKREIKFHIRFNPTILKSNMAVNKGKKRWIRFHIRFNPSVSNIAVNKFQVSCPIQTSKEQVEEKEEKVEDRCIVNRNIRNWLSTKSWTNIKLRAKKTLGKVMYFWQIFWANFWG